MPVFRGEPAALHPKFPTGSQAGIIESGGPTALDASVLTYTAEDDKAIEQYVRESGECSRPSTSISLSPHAVVATCWHSVSISPANIFVRIELRFSDGNVRHEAAC